MALLVVAGKHLRAAELSRLSYWEVVVAMMIGAAAFGESVSLLSVLIVVGAMVPVGAGRFR